MAKVFLKFRDKVISETILGSSVITVGRDLGNDIQIDNPIVSGIHARLWQEEGKIYVEDADSTNGTYIGEEKIKRAAIGSGDKVLIGKHTIQIITDEGEAATEGEEDEPLTPVTPSLDNTMVLDSKIKRELTEGADEKKGEFVVIGGHAGADSYELSDRVTTIGKSSAALIKIKGLFAPKVAALVNKTDKGYTISSGDRKNPPKVNGTPIGEHHLLENKDVVEVGGLTLQFIDK